MKEFQKTMDSVKVSVIMPVYNSGHFLKTAVDSILTQSMKEFELILVDDGSTDGSSDLCDQYALSDPRVRVIHQKNQGLCNARNAALSIAKGEYVAFSDHDDNYLPGLLEDNYSLAESNNLDFIKFCKIWDTYNVDKLVSSSTNYFPDGVKTRAEIKSLLMDLNKRDFFSCVWDGLYKASFLQSNNLVFDPYFKFGGEDYDFIYRCLIHAERIGFNSKAYYHHYTRSNFSTSSKYDPNKVNVVLRRFNRYKELLDTYNVDLDEYKEEYTRFFIKDCIVSVIMQLNRGSITTSELEKCFENISKETFVPDYINTYKLSWIKYKHLRFVQECYCKKHYRFLSLIYRIKEFVRLKLIH